MERHYPWPGSTQSYEQQQTQFDGGVYIPRKVAAMATCDRCGKEHEPLDDYDDSHVIDCQPDAAWELAEKIRDEIPDLAGPTKKFWSAWNRGVAIIARHIREELGRLRPLESAAKAVVDAWKEAKKPHDLNKPVGIRFLETLNVLAKVLEKK
jgi:hypothetical protein